MVPQSWIKLACQPKKGFNKRLLGEIRKKEAARAAQARDGYV